MTKQCGKQRLKHSGWSFCLFQCRFLLDNIFLYIIGIRNLFSNYSPNRSSMTFLHIKLMIINKFLTIPNFPLSDVVSVPFTSVNGDSTVIYIYSSAVEYSQLKYISLNSIFGLYFLFGHFLNFRHFLLSSDYKSILNILVKV